MKHISILLLFVTGLLDPSWNSAYCQSLYNITDLGTIGGTVVWAKAINDSGHIAGYAENAAGFNRAFLWKGGIITDLGVAGAAILSEATGINNLDQVVGFTTDSIGGHTFLWQNGSMTILPGFGNHVSVPNAVNDAGRIVGLYYNPGERGFLWKNDVVTDLGVLSTSEALTEAKDINASGTIVGHSRAPDGQAHPVFWKNGVMTDLGALIGKAGEAIAINDSGHIIGTYGDSLGSHPFLWKDGTLITLDTVSHWGVRSINNYDQILGDDAIVWDQDTIKILQNLIDPDSGWTLITADCINDRGEIVGLGSHNGLQRGYLLQPRGLTGVDEHMNAHMPNTIHLMQNYPNPFNPDTRISFVLGSATSVTLKVYDVLGRDLATLVDEKLQPGTYTRTWAAARVGSGVYWYRLTAGTFTASKSMLLVR